jgi:multiple sugar transport system permease protein
MRRRFAPGAALLGSVLLLWTLVPLYNMVLVSLQAGDAVFSNHLWPADATLANYATVLRQGHWYLTNFWAQMGNSALVGAAVAALVIAVGTLASFAITRLRLRGGWLLSNAALLTYVIPMSFLAIPFYKIMHAYGLADHLLSVILVEVAFATPYAILIFSQYSAGIPHELDEAARVDGASPPAIYWHVFLPLMAPALVAVGTYALLLAWNEYLYAFLMLSTPTRVTLPVALGYFLSSDEAPWNLLMAAALVYSLPPLAVYYLFRRHMEAGLTLGGVKG